MSIHDDSEPIVLPASFDDAPEWARDLYRQNVEIKRVHIKVLLIVDEIKPEVMGVVEKLQSNPMMKMFLGK